MPPGSRPSDYGAGGCPLGLPPAACARRAMKSPTNSPGFARFWSAATCSLVRLMVVAAGGAAVGRRRQRQRPPLLRQPEAGRALLGEQPAEVRMLEVAHLRQDHRAAEPGREHDHVVPGQLHELAGLDKRRPGVGGGRGDLAEPSLAGRAALDRDLVARQLALALDRAGREAGRDRSAAGSWRRARGPARTPARPANSSCAHSSARTP